LLIIKYTILTTLSQALFSRSEMGNKEYLHCKFRMFALFPEYPL